MFLVIESIFAAPPRVKPFFRVSLPLCAVFFAPEPFRNPRIFDARQAILGRSITSIALKNQTHFATPFRQIVVRLSNDEREIIDRIRSKGVHPARQVTRAHILGALDRGVPDRQVSAVLEVSRKAVWRTRSAYQERGVRYALEDVPRPGAPRKYEGTAEAEVAALASGPAPAGAKRWTIQLLVQELRKRPGLAKINRESVRQFLKKTS